MGIFGKKIKQNLAIKFINGLSIWYKQKGLQIKSF